MIDIVVRLRNLTEPRFSSYPVASVIGEAAETIEYLRFRNAVLEREIDRLREEVEYFAEGW